MNLVFARKVKGLTQTQLDDEAGLPRGTVNDLERGRNKNPSWEVVSRIARVIGVPPEDIFPISEEKSA